MKFKKSDSAGIYEVFFKRGKPSFTNRNYALKTALNTSIYQKITS